MSEVVSQFTGGISASARHDPPATDTVLEAYTKPSIDQEYTIFHMAIMDPETVIRTAIHEPDKLRRGEVPYGVWKPLFMGTLDRCREFEKRMIDEGRFEKLSRVETGRYYRIMPTEATREKIKEEFIEAKSREILYKDKLETRSKFSKDRDIAMNRFDEASKYDERVRDPEDIMHYVQLRYNEQFIRSNAENASKALREATTSLRRVSDEISDIDIKHPEFADKWKGELTSYCAMIGIPNPFDLAA